MSDDNEQQDAQPIDDVGGPADPTPAVPVGGKYPPPAEHRFKPGQSGNPKGRPPSAGQSLIEAMNDLAAAGLDEDQLRAICKNRRESFVRRTAARESLRMIEDGDLADFEDVMAGRETLADLRARGINTEIVKRCKRTTKNVQVIGGASDGTNVESEFICEVELHDRAGSHVDRIIDRTEGRAVQSVKVQAGADPKSKDAYIGDLANDPAVHAQLIALQSALLNPGGAGGVADEG